MSYATLEAAVSTVIQKHADFDATNCSQGDYRQVGHGKARVAVLTYGGVRQEDLTLSQIRLTWTINIDLFVPWGGQITTWQTNFATERQKIVDTLAQWPQLDAAANVVSARILNGAAPGTASLERGAYRGERLFLEVAEVVSASRQE